MPDQPQYAQGTEDLMGPPNDCSDLGPRSFERPELLILFFEMSNRLVDHGVDLFRRVGSERLGSTVSYLCHEGRASVRQLESRIIRFDRRGQQRSLFSY